MKPNILPFSVSIISRRILFLTEDSLYTRCACSIESCTAASSVILDLLERREGNKLKNDDELLGLSTSSLGDLSSSLFSMSMLEVLRNLPWTKLSVLRDRTTADMRFMLADLSMPANLGNPCKD